MNDRKPKVRWWQFVIIFAATEAVQLILDLPFSRGLGEQINPFSAWMCEVLMNGLGFPVERVGTRLQSISQTQAFHLDFQDGGWILKQIYLLVPMVLFFGITGRRSLWKLVLVGLLAISVGLRVRACLLGFNAAHWGQEAAAGWLDTVVRMGVVLGVMVSMAGVREKAVKLGKPSDSGTEG